MKKHLFLLILPLLMTAATAQEHLTFKGIPIDGSLKTFTRQLQDKGYRLMSSNDGVSTLSGDFAGYKHCTLIAAAEKKNDTVNAVSVMFPAYEQWNLLDSCYTDLHRMLIYKYGLSSSQQGFRGKGDEMEQIREGKCMYKEKYPSRNGELEMSIEYTPGYGCYVLLKYYDGENSGIKGFWYPAKKAAYDDL